MLENFFHLKENKTDVKTELMAGLTTFMTMAYILAVNPSILSAAGMDGSAVLLATALASFVGCLAMALMAGVSLGLYENYEEAVAKACTFSRVYEPDAVNARKYDLLYELYRKARLHYQEIWDYRHQMNKKIKAIGEENGQK